MKNKIIYLVLFILINLFLNCHESKLNDKNYFFSDSTQVKKVFEEESSITKLINSLEELQIQFLLVPEVILGIGEVEKEQIVGRSKIEKLYTQGPWKRWENNNGENQSPISILEKIITKGHLFLLEKKHKDLKNLSELNESEKANLAKLINDQFSFLIAKLRNDTSAHYDFCEQNVFVSLLRIVEFSFEEKNELSSQRHAYIKELDLMKFAKNKETIGLVKKIIEASKSIFFDFDFAKLLEIKVLGFKINSIEASKFIQQYTHNIIKQTNSSVEKLEEVFKNKKNKEIKIQKTLQFHAIPYSEIFDKIFNIFKLLERGEYKKAKYEIYYLREKYKIREHGEGRYDKIYEKKRAQIIEILEGMKKNILEDLAI